MLNRTIDIIDRAGGWLLYQVDNNDYLAGFIAGLKQKLRRTVLQKLNPAPQRKEFTAA